MKKTLLASALLLAFATYANAATLYIEGATDISGNSDKYTSADKERVLGGYFVKNTDTTEAKKELNSEVKVTGGNFNYVVGGHYVSDHTSELDLNVASTNVVIEGENTNVYFLAAGTASSNATNLTHAGSKQSNLTIRGGTFGHTKLQTNVMEQLVLGGDLLKSGGNGQASSSSIQKVNVLIEGGEFNSAVIGGSSAYGFYETPKSLTTTVGEVEMNITGGTFNHAIIAGGMAGGHNSTSTVGTATLNISGAKGNLSINDNIYAGGLYTNVQETTKASVDKATVNVDNATIKGVYGTAASAAMENSNWQAEGNKWVYTPKDVTTVSTTLSLTNVTAETVNVPVGSVALRAENEKQTIIDKLIVAEDGSVKVTLTTDGATNDKYKGKIEEAIVIKDGWEYASAEEITMAEGLEMGEVTLVDGKLVEKTNSVQLATLDMASALPLAMGRILMNDVRKRLGDIRSAEGTHGVWARYDGGEMSGDKDFENKFHTVQIGIDTVPTPDSGRFGVAFSYTKGDSEFGRGESDMDAFSLAAYGTWIADNGMFAAVIGRMATIDNDLTIDNSIGAKTDNVLLSLSGEIGWRFNVNETFYLEPQAELTYTYVNSDRFSLNSVTYDVDATDSLIARVGFAAGLKCPNNMGDVYVRVSGIHEFLGDSAVQAGTANPVELDGEDTWVEFGLGAQFNVNKNTYVYADIERTEGATMDEDWRANVGVRFAF